MNQLPIRGEKQYSQLHRATETGSCGPLDRLLKAYMYPLQRLLTCMDIVESPVKSIIGFCFLFQVPLNEYDFSASKIYNIQSQVRFL